MARPEFRGQEREGSPLWTTRRGAGALTTVSGQKRTRPRLGSSGRLKQGGAASHGAREVRLLLVHVAADEDDADRGATVVCCCRYPVVLAAASPLTDKRQEGRCAPGRRAEVCSPRARTAAGSRRPERRAPHRWSCLPRGQARFILPEELVPQAAAASRGPDPHLRGERWTAP